MTKLEMIEQIRVHNRSADAEFLARFDEPTLGGYLDRLTRLHGQRGRHSVQVRPDASPASCTRLPARRRPHTPPSHRAAA